MDNNYNNKNEPPKNMWQQTKTYKLIFLTVAAVILFTYLLFNISSVASIINRYIGYIMPMIFGVSIAYLLNPVMMFFRKYLYRFFSTRKNKSIQRRAKGYAKGFSIAIAVSIGLLVIISLLLLIIPELINSFIELGKILPSLLDELVNWFDSFSFPESDFSTSIQGLFDEGINQLKTWISGFMVPTLESAFDYIKSGVVSVFTFIFQFFIGIVVAVYALKDKEIFNASLKKIIYTFFKPKTANKIVLTARHGHEIFGNFLVGRIIDSFIVGIICFIFTMATSMPYAFLVSVFIGVMNIIPFFGPFIAGIPSFLIILMIDPMKGLIFAIFVVVLQQIDGNIIEPKIIGTTTGISEFWVTFSLLLFGGMFGFVGMIIAVPLFAVIYYLLKGYINARAEKRKLATATGFYLDVDHYDPETGEFVMLDPETTAQKKREKKNIKSAKRKNRMRRFKNLFNKKKKDNKDE